MATTPNYPYPAAVHNIVRTTDPVGKGDQDGQLWIRRDNNNVWYWSDDLQDWVKLITS